MNLKVFDWERREKNKESDDIEFRTSKSSELFGYAQVDKIICTPKAHKEMHKCRSS